MPRLFDLLSSRADLAARDVEAWRVAHDRAGLVHALELLYAEAAPLLEHFLAFDTETERQATRERWGEERYAKAEAERDAAMAALLRFYRALRDACARFEADRYANPVCSLPALDALIARCERLADVDDQSYIDRPDVAAALEQGEREAAAGELEPLLDDVAA